MDHTDSSEPERTSEHDSVASPAPDADPIARRANRRRSFWRVVKGGALFGIVSFCVALGVTAGYLHRTNDIFRTWADETSKHPVTAIKHYKDPLAAFRPDLQLPPQSQHRANILLVGADSDYEESRPVALKNTHGRSDALMVVQVDFDKNSIALLSIPRDTAVIIPNYDGRIHKINAAHAYGGPALTQQTVESAFGIHTDYYISLNFEAFQKVVDAIGGVDITVSKPLKYDDNWGNLHIDLKPGFQHLDGYKAMGYVRIRHVDDDVHRAERQHEFVEAMRAKITDANTFGKLPNALNAITQNIDSDLSIAQQLTFVNFARNVPRANFQVATLPSTEGRSFVYANVPESEKLISRLFFADRPNAVKVTVPDPPTLASRRVLIARASGAGHRRRHRRKRATPAAVRETIGIGEEYWSSSLARISPVSRACSPQV